jgi:hypothetical protein
VNGSPCPENHRFVDRLRRSGLTTPAAGSELAGPRTAAINGGALEVRCGERSVWFGRPRRAVHRFDVRCHPAASDSARQCREDAALMRSP